MPANGRFARAMSPFPVEKCVKRVTFDRNILNQCTWKHLESLFQFLFCFVFCFFVCLFVCFVFLVFFCFGLFVVLFSVNLKLLSESRVCLPIVQ